MGIMFGTLDLERVDLNKDQSQPPKSKLSISTLLPEPLSPPQLLVKVNAKVNEETKDVWPSGMHVRKDRMVLVDRDNKKVKVRIFLERFILNFF